MKTRVQKGIARTDIAIKFFLPLIFLTITIYLVFNYPYDDPFRPIGFVFNGLFIILILFLLLTLSIPFYTIVLDKTSYSLIIRSRLYRMKRYRQVIPLSKIEGAYVKNENLSNTLFKGDVLYIKLQGLKVIQVFEIADPRRVAVKINKLLKTRIENYQSLKQSKLQTLPGEELIDAVVTWLNNKIEKDNLSIELLNQPSQYVWACNQILESIKSGGLSKLYFYQTKHLIDLGRNGFHIMGDETLVNLLRKAETIYQKNIEVMDRYFDGSNEGFVQFYNEDFFDELYSEVARIDWDSIEQHLITYIKDNVYEFGE